MSPTDSEVSKPEEPNLAQAMSAVQAWLEAHRQVDVVYPKRLIWELKLAPLQVGSVLVLLARQGKLKRRFAVEAPNGVLAEALFADPAEMPEILYDTSERPFRSEEGEVVEVFERVSS